MIPAHSLLVVRPSKIFHCFSFSNTTSLPSFTRAPFATPFQGSSQDFMFTIAALRNKASSLYVTLTDNPLLKDCAQGA